jgi:hypothetical protein
MGPPSELHRSLARSLTHSLAVRTCPRRVHSLWTLARSALASQASGFRLFEGRRQRARSVGSSSGKQPPQAAEAESSTHQVEEDHPRDPRDPRTQGTQGTQGREDASLDRWRTQEARLSSQGLRDSGVPSDSAAATRPEQKAPGELTSGCRQRPVES